MPDVIKILLTSLCSVVVLFIIAKLLGKKQISQLEFIDYVLGISIGSIAAEMATDLTDSPFYYYIIAMAVFLLFDIITTLVGRKGARLKRFLKGKPLVIIYEGKLIYDNLFKSKLDINDLLQLCREQGYFDLKDIAYAIFENSGKISVLPVASKRPTTAEDLSIPLEKQKLPNYVIIDGEISYSGLNEINKNEEWLYKRLKLKTKKDLKNLILVSYNDTEDTFEVHKK